VQDYHIVFQVHYVGMPLVEAVECVQTPQVLLPALADLVLAAMAAQLQIT
jgi:hypothetical protein